MPALPGESLPPLLPLFSAPPPRLHPSLPSLSALPSDSGSPTGSRLPSPPPPFHPVSHILTGRLSHLLLSVSGRPPRGHPCPVGPPLLRQRRHRHAPAAVQRPPPHPHGAPRRLVGGNLQGAALPTLRFLASASPSLVSPLNPTCLDPPLPSPLHSEALSASAPPAPQVVSFSPRFLGTAAMRRTARHQSQEPKSPDSATRGSPRPGASPGATNPWDELKAVPLAPRIG